MTARYATRDRVFAIVADERPFSRIAAIMWQQFRVRPGATREQLRRLVQQGRITRPTKGTYQAVTMCASHPTAPADAAGMCRACIVAERAWKAPYAALLIDAAQALGWQDLAREAQRRIALYEMEGES